MKKLLWDKTATRFLAICLILMSLLAVANPIYAGITFSKTDATSCNATDGTATVTVTNGKEPYTYAWSNGASGASINNLGVGTYTVNITDANGCEGSGSVTIEDMSAMNLTISGGGVIIQICDQNPSTTLTATASGGTPPYTYSWPGGSLTVSSSGFYSVTVTDSKGCTESATTFVWFVPILCSRDPNDIAGPVGYSTEQWVSVNDVLPYTIRFENDPDFASAPAQKVVVTFPIDPNLNIFSLRLSDFGFGNFIFQVPQNSTFYSSRLDVRDSLNIFVDVLAGIDVTKNEAFWIFESIDPATGLSPTDASIGFLPINDSTTHLGEGFVSFTIQPKNSSHTGDSIHAAASIVFDVNDPISTNLWVNIIDALPPNSAVDSLPPTLDSTTFTISWNGQDDMGGSGINNYALYYTENGGTLNLFQNLIPDTIQSLVFSGNSGSTYEFFTIATDNTGNREPLKDSGDIVVTLNEFELLKPDQSTIHCAGDSLMITWNITGVSSININLSDGMGNTIAIDSNVSTLSGGYSWLIPTSLVSGNTYSVHIFDSNLNGATDSSEAFVIHALPIADAGIDISICQGDSIQLSASGGTSYSWQPSVGLNNSTIANPIANPQTSTTYFVMVTDSNSCVTLDSLVVTVLNISTPDTVFVSSCNPVDTGIVVQNLTNQSGCDSIVTTITTLLPSDAVTVNLESCNPADTGIVVQNLTNQSGCDSVVTTITTLLSSDAVTVNLESCNPADTGIVVQNLTNQSGCDSIVTTITKLLPSDAVTVNLASCNPVDTGIVVQNLTNQSGCDSIVTTITTLLPSDVVTVNLASCNPADTGIVVQNLTNQYGCDSVVFTITTLLPSDAVSVNLESCNPADTGIVVQNLTNQSGCDSLVTTITTLLPSYAVTVNLESCNPADTGIVVQNLTNQSGCDSIVTTITTLLPSDAVTINLESCNPADTGIVVQNLTNQLGCDSIVTTITTLLPSDAVTINLASCNPADTGIVVQNLTNQSGCDSVVTTITTLLSSDAVTVNLASCNPADTGILVQNLTNQYGCDSVVTIVTILVPSYDILINETSCNPDDTGRVVQNLLASSGCDSMVTTITTLLPSDVVTINLESCNPADIGIVVQNLTNQYGCDSVVTTVTILVPSYDILINETSCNPADTGIVVQNLLASSGCDSLVTTITTLLPSDDVTINLESCNPADIGIVVQNLTNQYGCDSVVTTVTILVPSYDILINETSCNPADTGIVVQNLLASSGCDSMVTTITTLLPSDAVTINLESCNPADTGIVMQNLINQYGCDSVVTTVTILVPSYDILINETSCNPADTGIVVQNLLASSGCDSIVTTITTLLPSDAVTINLESCNPADSGIVVQNLINQYGCDSVVTTATILIPGYDILINETSCNPADTGMVVQNLLASSGCDSIVTTITTLLPSDAVTINLESCNPADTGIVVQNLTNQYGCDSVVTTVTILVPSYDILINETSCNPADTGIVVQNLLASSGCDSMVTTITTLLPSDAVIINLESCNPADIGIVVQNLTNQYGCDSVVTTVTILVPSYDILINETSCNPADTGIVVQNLLASSGCDSIVTTITTLLPSDAVNINLESCNPADTGIVVQNLTNQYGCDSVVTTVTILIPGYDILINETSCNPADTGIVVQNLLASSGCDSMVTTITTLLPSDDVTINLESCNAADTGIVVQNLTNQYGCDSVVTTITIFVPSYDILINETSCNPDDTGRVVQNLLASSGCDSLVTTITTLLPSNSVTINLESCNAADTGSVVQNLTNQYGCDSVVTTVTILIPGYIEFPDTVLLACDPNSGTGEYCLPIPFADFISKYELLIDNEVYFDLPYICDLDTVGGGYDFSFAIEGIPPTYGGNEHWLLGWEINGIEQVTEDFYYNSFEELVNYMNVLDPNGDWVLEGDMTNSGFQFSTPDYGYLDIFSPGVGAESFTTYSGGLISLGTLIENIPCGCHWFTLTNMESPNCIDSIYVCLDDPSITTDTFYVEVAVNSSTNSLCPTADDIDNTTVITYSLCETEGLFGTASLSTDNDGCIIYHAGSIAGNFEDTICVVGIDNLGSMDTSVFIISITCNDLFYTQNLTTCDSTEVGIFIDSFGLVSGCDSIVTTNITLGDDCGEDCNIPENLYATNITFTQATLGWDAVADAIRYEVQGKIKNGPLGLSRYLIVYTNAFRTNNLFPFLTYRYRVRAECPEFGWTGWSTWFEFTLNPFLYLNIASNSSPIVLRDLEVKEFLDVDQILIAYPNPTRGELSYYYWGEEMKDIKITITDITGKILNSTSIDLMFGKNIGFNISAYESGMYFINFYKNDVQLGIEKVLLEK